MTEQSNITEMPTVWRLQEPYPGVPRDYSSCKGYGEMKTILNHDARPSSFPTTALVQLMEAFADFKEGDYILWSGGDPITPLLAGMALMCVMPPVELVRWLRWDRRTNPDGSRSDKGYYVPVDVPIDAAIALTDNEEKPDAKLC